MPTLTVLPPALFVPYTGVLDRVRGNGVDILCGAGVGGGSLVYHGMTLKPSEAVFAEVLPQLSYGELDRTYYPRVAQMLSVATIPDDVLNSPRYPSNQIFTAHIKAAGMTPSRIPVESHVMSVIGYGVTPVRGSFQYCAITDAVVLNYPVTPKPISTRPSRRR
jgi:cholesterol oxidase